MLLEMGNIHNCELESVYICTLSRKNEWSKTLAIDPLLKPARTLDCWMEDKVKHMRRREVTNQHVSNIRTPSKMSGDVCVL